MSRVPGEPRVSVGGGSPTARTFGLVDDRREVEDDLRLGEAGPQAAVRPQAEGNEGVALAVFGAAREIENAGTCEPPVLSRTGQRSALHCSPSVFHDRP